MNVKLAALISTVPKVLLKYGPPDADHQNFVL